VNSVIDKLTPKERLALVHLYSTEGYSALRKLVELERLELAKDHVDQMDILQIRYLSGQTKSLKKLIQTIDSAYKESEKKS